LRIVGGGAAAWFGIAAVKQAACPDEGVCAMEMALFVLTILMMLITGVVVFLYLRSSFELLEMVREDEALWTRLGCPEKIYGRDFDHRIVTISPLGPWLSWVYSGRTAGLQRDIAERLVITRNMLITAFVLFMLTTVVGGMLMLVGFN
jgi:hypothetical protein